MSRFVDTAFVLRLAALFVLVPWLTYVWGNGVLEDQKHGHSWHRECAQHRPLADCQRDWKAMNGP